MDQTAVHYHNASPLAAHHRGKAFNDPTHVASAMRLRPDLTFKKLSFNKRIRDSRVFFFDIHVSKMATRINPEENIEKKEEEEDRKSKELAPPPPPEKPEPGDCCGSGCVRCVWDVYYEELEAYDKLYNQSDSGNSKSK